MKIKLIKVYNNGKGIRREPGQIVEGNLAKKIKKNHPNWCIKIEEKKEGDK